MNKINKIITMLYEYKKLIAERKATQWTHQGGKFITPMDPDDLLSEVIAKVMKIDASK